MNETDQIVSNETSSRIRQSNREIVAIIGIEELLFLSCGTELKCPRISKSHVIYQSAKENGRKALLKSIETNETRDATKKGVHFLVCGAASVILL